jgi:hypothetical protein
MPDAPQRGDEAATLRETEAHISCIGGRRLTHTSTHSTHTHAFFPLQAAAVRFLPPLWPWRQRGATGPWWRGC